MPKAYESLLAEIENLRGGVHDFVSTAAYNEDKIALATYRPMRRYLDGALNALRQFNLGETRKILELYADGGTFADHVTVKDVSQFTALVARLDSIIDALKLL